MKKPRPFDVWLLMKDEEDIATAGGSKAGDQSIGLRTFDGYLHLV